MRLKLNEHMKKLLNEVIDNGLEIAFKAEDHELESSYLDLKRSLSRSDYSSFKKHHIEAFWFLADSGYRTCEMLIEKSTSPEQLEKTSEIKQVYIDIKNHLTDVATQFNNKKKVK